MAGKKRAGGQNGGAAANGGGAAGGGGGKKKAPKPKGTLLPGLLDTLPDQPGTAHWGLPPAAAAPHRRSSPPPTRRRRPLARPLHRALGPGGPL